MNEELYFKSSTDIIKVRCPSCYKLYSVSSAEISEPKPKFECFDCHQRFWMPFPEALEQKEGLMGFPLEWLEKEVVTPVEVKAFQCPSCEAPYSGGQKECGHCGIIFEKFEARQFDLNMPPASPELKERWDQVVAQYEDSVCHQNFVSQALGEGALDYAQARYTQILEVNPTDLVAEKFLQQVKALRIARVEARVPVTERTPRVLKLPHLRLGTFILFLCGVVIAMGLIIPGARNLVGMGSAFLFLVLALRYYFRVI